MTSCADAMCHCRVNALCNCAEIMAIVTEEAFDELDAPPERITGAEVCIHRLQETGTVLVASQTSCCTFSRLRNQFHTALFGDSGRFRLALRVDLTCQVLNARMSTPGNTEVSKRPFRPVSPAQSPPERLASGCRSRCPTQLTLRHWLCPQSTMLCG